MPLTESTEQPDFCPREDTIITAAATGDTISLCRELDVGKAVDTRDLEHHRTLLHWAVLGGQHAAVELLLSRNADLSISDPSDDRTPLHIAVAGGHLNLMKQLLMADGPTNTWDRTGETPLFLACREGNKNVIKLLLKAGADPDLSASNSSRQTPLSLAAKMGSKSITRLLLNHNATVGLVDGHGMTPLLYAIREGHNDIAALLSKREALNDSRTAGDIWEDAMSYLRQDSHDPYKDLELGTALLAAAKGERLDIVNNRLERGVDADTCDDKGRTSLSHAAGVGHVDIASVLLQKGASPNTKDGEGQTPLFYAAAGGHIDVVSVLLSNGADVDLAHLGGWTPLMAAAEQGHEEAVALLLEHGADPNARDDDHFTPILEAAIGGYPDIVVRLLDAGADPDARDRANNLSAISWAAEQGNEDVIKLLLERGVNPNMDNRTLLTALYGFSSNDISGSHAVMEMLVGHGADVFMNCWTDERPLVIAAEQGRFLTVELFLKASYSSSSVRQEHIWDAIGAAAEHGEAAILSRLMEHYDPDETETETPWEWAKSYRFGQSYKLLRPYFEPDAESDNDGDESDE